jgi:hypothetical protein
MFTNLFELVRLNFDTDNPGATGAALAAFGVLKAALGNEQLPEDEAQLRYILTDLLRNRPLTPWRLPIDENGLHSESVSLPASLLARVWWDVERETDTRYGGQYGARLAISNQPSMSLADVLSSLRSLSGQLLGYVPGPFGMESTWSGISSIIVPIVLPSDWQWGWPLRIGVLPEPGIHELTSSVRAQDMFRRNLASISILGEDDTECDLLMAPMPISAIDGNLRSLGLHIRAGAVATFTDRPVRIHQLDTSVNVLHQQLGACAFAVHVIPDSFIGAWADYFVRTLSHNMPLDVALWKADIASSSQGREYDKQHPLPVIIADPDFLNRAMLKQTVEDLAGRMERLSDLGSITLSPPAASRLGVPEGEYDFIDLTSRLRAMAADADQFFDAERDEATAVSELEQSVASIESRSVRKLYADLTFSDLSTNTRIEDTEEPLIEERTYELEVALRGTRTGVSYRGASPKTVAPPPAGEQVELLVIVSAREEDFDIPNPVQLLHLPAEVQADSDINAVFEVTPQRRTTDKSSLAEIEVRILYEFNLIEHLVLNAEVLDRNTPAHALITNLGLAPPIFVKQDSSVGRDYTDLVRNLQPRQMSIDIRRADDLYRFSITARENAYPESGEQNREVALHARSEISPIELTRELNRIRELWERIVIEGYPSEVEGSKPLYRKSLRDLARAGRDLWSLLFRGRKDSAMWHIGEWLKKHPPTDGAVIEIKLLEGTTSFVFPWSLLYDRPVPRATNELPDAGGFWGLRYSVEQKFVNGRSAADHSVNLGADGLDLTFMIWDSFSNASDQKRFLSELSDESGQRIKVSTPPVNDLDRFYKLIAECDADILYFYTHGNTRPPEVDSAYRELKRLQQRYEKLPENAPARTALKELYDLISHPDFEPDETWIALTYGRILLRDLRAETVELKRNPIVILNMCQSAQILPGLSESFITFFLDRKARSVIGTECPMTNTFAHPFSQHLLRGLLEGQTLGDALRSARLYFIEKRNPLGLAYTLFGSANTRYDPGLISGKPTQ